MSIVVSSIDEHQVNRLLKDCPKDVQNYVKALKGALSRQKLLTDKAIKSLKK